MRNTTSGGSFTMWMKLTLKGKNVDLYSNMKMKEPQKTKRFSFVSKTHLFKAKNIELDVIVIYMLKCNNWNSPLCIVKVFVLTRLSNHPLCVFWLDNFNICIFIFILKSSTKNFISKEIKQGEGKVIPRTCNEVGGK